MTEGVIAIGGIAFFALFAVALLWKVRKIFVRHDPARAAASVTVAANVAFELQLPGSPGELFFRFDIDGDTDFDYDLLVSGEIVDERGGTRAFAVKTSKQSRIEGADSARDAGTTYAVTTRTTYAVTRGTGSFSLATVRTGDRAVRGVVTERPSGLLRKGWVYVPRGSGSALERIASDAGSTISAAELRASGQRVTGVLKSFHATGKTPRSRGLTPSRPEFLDYPFYRLKVELQLPNQGPVVGRIRQPVPPTEVPNLAIGRELNCAVDPADPARRWVVDWG
jgi:hypothetical protein